MRKINRADAGFSLVETVVVLAIMMVVASIAIFQSFGSLESYRANAAMDVVISQLRVARQLAISQRRNVIVKFAPGANPPTISYQVWAPGDTVQPAAVIVPISSVTFSGFSGEPDTPMAFGTCGGTYGVCIANLSGGPAAMQFTSVGQFTDGTGVNTLNGTIFLYSQGQHPTARAVTILGSTGRVRSYTYTSGSGSSAWME